MSRRALLLSGGLDSIALAVLSRPERAITINYGQVCARAELRAARSIADAVSIPLDVIQVDCRELGSGDLAGQPSLAGAPSSEWWPFRNQLLASLAAPVALRLGIEELVFGTVSTDDFHSDGTAAFFERLDALMSMQEGGIRVSAPAIAWSSAGLIRRANIGLEVLGWAHSCHTGDWPCGVCRGCHKHASVLRELGLL